MVHKMTLIDVRKETYLWDTVVIITQEDTMFDVEMVTALSIPPL